MDAIHTGACLCGAIRYAVRGPLRPVVVCHCSQCRRQTGHYLAASSVALERFDLHAHESLRWYRASDTAERGFCVEGHIFCADKGDYYDVPREGYQRDGWT